MIADSYCYLDSNKDAYLSVSEFTLTIGPVSKKNLTRMRRRNAILKYKTYDCDLS